MPQEEWKCSVPNSDEVIAANWLATGEASGFGGDSFHVQETAKFSLYLPIGPS